MEIDEDEKPENEVGILTCIKHVTFTCKNAPFTRYQISQVCLKHVTFTCKNAPFTRYQISQVY